MRKVFSLFPTLKFPPTIPAVPVPRFPPLIMRLLPENIEEPRSLAPWLLVLLRLPRKEYWLLSIKRLAMALSSYMPLRSFISVPPPACPVPNQPCFMPSFTVRFITVSSSPSSTPEKRASSDLRSTTWIFSTMLAGRFFEATLGSSVKNSSPSIRIFVTSFPCTVIFPSSSTSTPGNFLNMSSTTALGCVL